MNGKEKILDLGVGEGDSYLLNDKERAFRVGADIHMWPLQSTRDFNLTNQVLLDAKNNLPFVSGSFHRIQLFFPDRSLLECVCNENSTTRSRSLWPELYRILNEQGVVELFLDEYKYMPFSTSRYDDDRNIRYIWKPHVKVKKAAEKHGFNVTVGHLEKESI